MSEHVQVEKDDYVAARCTYNSTGQNKIINIGKKSLILRLHTYNFMFVGATAGDEMCNLYLMYYTNGDDSSDMRYCGDQELDMSKEFPVDSDWPLPKLSVEDPFSPQKGHVLVKRSYGTNNRGSSYSSNIHPPAPVAAPLPYGYPNYYAPAPPVVVHHHHAPQAYGPQMPYISQQQQQPMYYDYERQEPEVVQEDEEEEEIPRRKLPEQLLWDSHDFHGATEGPVFVFVAVIVLLLGS